MNTGSNIPGDRPEIKRPGGTMKTGNGGAPSKSQLLPVLTNWQDLPSKPYFIPGVIAVITTMVLFGFLGDATAAVTIKLYDLLPVRVPMFSIALALMMIGVLAYGLYRMIGKATPWWLIPAVAVFTAVLTESPVLTFLQNLFSFGMKLPGNDEPLLIAFIKMIFLAGLPEELLKSIPVLIGVWLGMKLKPGQTGMLSAFRVNEPLDGILIGVAAGVGFVFSETILLYVPRLMALNGDDDYFAPLMAKFLLLQQQFGYEHAVIEIQKYLKAPDLGIQLMIPRLLRIIAGHSAYAGVLGYYIGLSALKPEARWKILGTGLAVAVAMHAAWDSINNSLLHAALAVGCFTMLATVVMKAREISPNRARLMPSQLFDRFSRVAPAAGASRTYANPPPAPAQTYSHAPGPAPAAKPGAAAVSMTWDDGEKTLMLEIGSTRMPIGVGAKLLERQAPGTTASRADGVVGEISANPNDPAQLGIRNHSNQIWQVTTPAGERRELTPGRSVRLIRGTRIQLGDLVAQIN